MYSFVKNIIIIINNDKNLQWNLFPILCWKNLGQKEFP